MDTVKLREGDERPCKRHSLPTLLQIPHARFISMLTYKAELVDITVKVTEESSTSKASFLDLDPLPIRKNGDDTKYTFSGKRVKRGLYCASNGRYIHADCNGSGNIIRKVAPDAFVSKGVEDFAVHPVRITLTKQTTNRAKYCIALFRSVCWNCSSHLMTSGLPRTISLYVLSAPAGSILCNADPRSCPARAGNIEQCHKG
jgi:hypothetical protein